MFATKAMQAFRLHPFSSTVSEHEKVFGAQPSLGATVSYDMSVYHQSNSMPDLRRGFRSQARTKKHISHSRRAICSAQPEKPAEPKFKCGQNRAIQRDRQYQLELQAEWKKALEKELGPALEHKHESPLFDFVKSPQNEDSSFVSTWLQNGPQLEAALTKALPVCEAIPFPEIPTSTHQRLNEALDLWATVSHPSLQSPPDRFFRPAFCRLLIDTGIVDCEQAAGGVSYHRAVRCFDSMALSTCKADEAGSGGLLGSLPCISFDHVCELVNQLLSHTRNPGLAQKNFFEQGLDSMSQIGQALLVRSRQRVKTRTSETAPTTGASINPNLVSTKYRKECLSIHGAPPRIFEGFVTDWTTGLDFWMHVGDTQTTFKAIEKQSSQEAALDNYIMDTIVEPGVLYFARVCEPIFSKLLDVYSDEKRKQWDDKGEMKHAKHLSFAAFFRFCVDFGLFPKLCSFEFAKRAYKEAECVEELGEPPPKPKEDDETLSDLSDDPPVVEQLPVKQPRRLSNAVLTLMRQNAARRNSASGGNGILGAAGRRNSFNMGSDGRALATPDSPIKRRASLATVVDVAAKFPGRRRNSVSSVPQDRSNSVSSGSGNVPDIILKQMSNSSLGQRRKSVGSIPDASMLSDIGKKVNLLKLPGDGTSKRGGSKTRSGTKGTAGNPSRNSSKALPKVSPAPSPRKQLNPIDMCWVKMSFAQMSEERLKAYALLRALGHCASDSFQTIVGLFDTVLDDEPELSDDDDASSRLSKKSKKPSCERMVDASDFLDALSRLNIKHNWDIEDAETFVKLLSPDSVDNTIRLLDLDKAVGRVREDMQRRSGKDPSCMGDSDAFYRSTEYEFDECGPARSPLGNLALGDEARVSENEIGWLCKAGETSTSLLFGPAAFMECLLRIAVKHLHSTGMPARSAMPGGAKAVWLLTHLNDRFIRIKAGEKLKQRTATPEAPPATTPSVVNSSPRVRTPGRSPEPEPERQRPMSSTTRASRGGQSRSQSVTMGSLPTNLLVERPSTGMSRKESNAGLPTKLPACGAPAQTPKAVKPDSSRKESRASDFSMIPGDMTYIPKRMRAVEHAQLFDGLPWLAKSGSGGKKCETCGCRESTDGLGSMHCHECSGVDRMRLAENPLWPVLRRQRLRREMKQADALKEDSTLDAKPDEDG